MIRNLQDLPIPAASVACDVVIVGGGIAGLLLATRLVRSGVHVVVLESGGVQDAGRPHPLNTVVQAGQPYRGAEEGRFRGLGGTSIRWGGAMLPFQACDLERRAAGWPAWPISLDELTQQFAELEKLFQLPPGPFDLDGERAGSAASDADFVLRSAKWPRFRSRNVAHVLKDEINREQPEIWLNATVMAFQARADGRLEGVQARAPNGHELSISAGVVVIAAGAIESTWLMLLLDAQHEHKLFRPHQLLGHYFFDHMSAPAATIEPPLDRSALNQAFGLRFARSGMRDVRMEPSADLRRRARLPAGFAHVTATSPTQTGFDSLREMYRDLQSGAALDWSHVLGVSRDLGWFFGAAWWWAAKRRLLAPRDAQYRIVVVTEQFPNRDSRITLSEDRAGPYGVPLARIDWRTTERDWEGFRAFQAELSRFWMKSPFRHLGRLELEPEAECRARLQNSSDIFHPGGTTRMGRTAATGVVDADLQSFQVRNLYVISTSAFPSGGGSNPTFTLMALALRAADRIAAEVSRR